MPETKQDTSTELVPFTQEFAIASRDEDAAAVIRENIGEGGMTVFDLDRVKIPAGGGISWEVPTLEGADSQRAVEGVIVAWRDPRAYWMTSIDESGGGAPPDCSSDEGLRGYGVYGVGSADHPTGECRTCPMSQWGSAKGGEARGQACKQMRLLFLLRREDRLPIAMFMPPTSIGPLRKYFLRLANRSLPYYSVVTRLRLEKARNADGIEFSTVLPEVAGRLAGDDVAAVKVYADSLADTLNAVRLNREDVELNGGDTG